MRVSKAKRAMATVLALLGLGLAGAALAGLTTLVISYGTGASPATAFIPADEPLSVRARSVSWRDDEPGLLRQVERQTRIDVAKAWVGAISGEADDVWFSGGALTRQSETVQLAQAHEGVPIKVEWIDHQVTAYFYSVDGQVMGLEVAATGFLDSGGGDTYWLEETYEVLMILRDGNWRVERLQRL